MTATHHRRAPRTAALFAAALTAAMTAMGPTTLMAEEPSQPVLVGGELDLDACGGLGIVTGLDPQGDNFLAVRAAPGSGNAEIDRLQADQAVNMCAQDGPWIGIVYTPGETLESGLTNCGVSTPIHPAEPYAGPCRSGWVFEDYVTLIAG